MESSPPTSGSPSSTPQPTLLASLSQKLAVERAYFFSLVILLPLLLGALLRAASVYYFTHIRYVYPDEREVYWELGQRFLNGHGISLANDAFGGYVRADEPSAYFGALFAPIVAALRIISLGRISIARLILGEAAWFGTALSMAAYARFHLSRSRVGLLLFALALFPNLHFIGSFVMTENVLIPLVCFALYLGAKISRSPRPAGPALYIWSALFGIIHLIKMNLLLFQPVQFLLDTRKLPVRQKAISAAIAVAITALILLPWAWRNHTVMGTWALETKSGFNLWLMNNPARNLPMLKEDFVAPPSPMPSYEGKNEAQRDAASKAMFMQFVRAHPAKFVQLCVSRFVIAYRFTPSSMNLPRPVALLYGTCNALVYFFALLGLKQCFRVKWFGDAAALVVYTVIITSLTNAAFRHRSYADPAMILLAVVGFNWVFQFFFPPPPEAE